LESNVRELAGNSRSR